MADVSPFSSPFSRPFAAFLFDMDGTLLNSIAAAERAWVRWATRHGIDPAELLKDMHGVRAEDTVRRWSREGMDVAAEIALITQDEIEDVEGVVSLLGVVPFLQSLPRDRWAIVTSASHALAMSRIRAAGVPLPDVLITAEAVKNGKPAPDGFLLAAQRLGVDPADCLVWEDSPAGVAAGAAAGGAVMVVNTTHASPMATAHPQTRDYVGLSVQVTASGALQLVVQPA